MCEFLSTNNKNKELQKCGLASSVPTLRFLGEMDTCMFTKIESQRATPKTSRWMNTNMLIDKIMH